MATRLNIGRDLNGTPCDTIYSSDTIIRGVLPAGVAISITVPENVDTVYFAYGGAANVWVDIKNEASLPSGNSEVSTAELNPNSRFVTPGQTISIICSLVNEYMASFYSAHLGNL